MEERVYKGSMLAVIKELILLAFAAVAMTIILSMFLELKYTLLIVAAIVVIFIFLTINDKRQTVIVTDRIVTFKKGNKKESYDINRCHFKAHINNSGSYLYVIDLEGEEHQYDVSMLGSRQFQRCIEDIGIVGEKAKPIHLKAKGEESNGSSD